jgi:hypothetical protein
MNDPQIREAFHRAFLQEHHNEPTTLVVDELGLEHGKCRADIAVINGHLEGYEIKSDTDSLNRLSSQIIKYNAVFDHATIILSDRHFDKVLSMVPKWWGIILVEEGYDDTLGFQFIRLPDKNQNVDDYAVAQLLWRDEVQEILMDLGVRGERLRERRAILYRYIVEMLESYDLRFIVREYLKKRQMWRLPVRPFPNGG